MVNPARTRTVSNTLQHPGTASPYRPTNVTIRLNVPGFINGGTAEKIRTRYVTPDATGLWSVDLEVNADIDPAGTSYTVHEAAGIAWTFIVPAGDAAVPVNLRDILVVDPANPNPLVAGVPLPVAQTPGKVATVAADGNSVEWDTPAAGGVTSFNSRGGAVVPAANDYTADQIADGSTNRLYTAAEKTKLGAITGTNTGDETTATIKSKLSITTLSGANTGDQDLSALAPKASPTFTGTVTVPTPTNPTDASTKQYVDSAVVGLLDFRGSYDASVNTFPASGGSGTAGAVVKGDLWSTSVGGTLGGVAVTAGDLIVALADAPGQTAASWDLVPHDGAYVTLTGNQTVAGTKTFSSAPIVPTQTAADNSTKAASTAYVDAADALKANLASPVFTGNPTVPTQTAGNNSTRAASTAYSDAAATAGVGQAISGAALGIGHGLTSGLPNNPAYNIEPTRGPNLWALASFSSNTNGVPTGNTNNTASLTPSITGTGVNHAVTTRMVLPTNGNPGTRYRVSVTVTTTAVTDGSFNGLQLWVAPRTSAGAVHAFYDRTGVSQATGSRLAFLPAGDTPLTSHTFVWELDTTADMVTGLVYLDVYMISPVSTTAGTMTLSNVSVYKVPALTRTMNVSWDRTPAANAQIFIDAPLGVDGNGLLRTSRFTFGPDSVLPVAPTNVWTYYDIALGANDRMKVATSIGTNYVTSTMFTNNSDLIVGVAKADGVTTELRGNTHGGETGQSGTFTTDFQLYADFGSGSWTQITAYDAYWWPCYRVKIVASTKFTRSDQGSPFMLASKTYYIYPDGTIRYDRTCTFQQDQIVDHFFWHMLSIPPNGYGTSVINAHAFRGKLGRGQQILGSVDFTTRLAMPDVPSSPTTATTGGTITGGLPYSVRVTALSEFGETAGSIKNYSIVVPAGTNTNTVTPTWSAVTGATGYAVYFGLFGYEKRVATVAAGTLTYAILGSEVPGQALPLVNTAVTQSASGMTSSERADWAAYYDPGMNAVLSMALDRTAVAAMTGVAGVRADLQRMDNSIMKNYWHLVFSGNDLPVTVANGTVFSGTVWYFVYQPTDPTNFEREQTIRGGAVAQLATVYPT